MSGLSKPFIILLSALLLLNFSLNRRSSNRGDVLDPISWQNEAAGLSVFQNTDRKTAGLGFHVITNNWPFFLLPGGVKGENSSLVGPIGIELGEIKNTDEIFVSFSENDVDWSHNQMSFLSNLASVVTLWVSRITPAILAQSSSNSIQLFTGDVKGYYFDGSSITPRPLGPSYPKYIAYHSAGQIQYHNLDEFQFTLPLLDQNWILLWYGTNSHFVETKKLLSYTHTNGHFGYMPQQFSYQADAPILMVFEQQPETIHNPYEGGVELNFQSSAGFFTLLPLFGRDHPNTAATETWSNGLPADVIERVYWWSQRLCDFPITVTETYDYQESTDTAIIDGNISFQNYCPGGIIFSPIPPMLSLVKNELNISLSGVYSDGHLNTEFGPTIGIDNTDYYSWRISGLNSFIDSERIMIFPEEPPPGFPLELENELESQVSKLINTGHLAPWIFTDEIPIHLYRGDIYWLNPADVIYHLVEIASALPASEIKTNLINYIKSERNAYSPEEIYNLPLDEGTIRTDFAISGSEVYQLWTNLRPDVFLNNVPLFNFYSLSQYYKITGETLPISVWQNALDTLDIAMREQDWASFYWFDGYSDRRDAVANSNRHFSGLVGFTRLAQVIGDIESEKLGRALLAKAAALRIGMVEYPRYLYYSNLTNLPQNASWQVDQTAGYWMGHLYINNWIDANNDPRQIADLDQFGVFLYDHSGYMAPWENWTDVWNLAACSAHLTTYRDITPELAKLLAKYEKSYNENYTDNLKSLYPHWYAGFAEGTLGEEHNLSHPTDSFQIFMSDALILELAPHKLLLNIDISWLNTGDLFYLHKIAETLKSYRGIVWDDSITLRGFPGNQTIYLYWEIYKALPEEMTWTITYSGPQGDQPSPITTIPGPQRDYLLTGLTNGSEYSIIINALMGNNILMSSDPIKVRPAAYFTYFPTIYNH